MSWIWVINMTQSLHWSPISSQHRAWNVPLLLNIITISLWQTPEQGQIKLHNHIQEISRTCLQDCLTRRGGHGCLATFSQHCLEIVDLIDWLPQNVRILYCKQTKYYVMLWYLPCLCDAPAASHQVKMFSQWSMPKWLHTFCEKSTKMKNVTTTKHIKVWRIIKSRRFVLHTPDPTLLCAVTLIFR